MNPEKWQQSAKGFLARTRRELWGNAGTDAQVTLYRMGFSVNGSLDALFGWNPRPMKRSAEHWGLGQETESILLPPGIVVPWVEEAAIRRLSVYSVDGEGIGISSVVPGSSSGSQISGWEHPLVVAVKGDLEGRRVMAEADAAGCFDLIVFPDAAPADEAAIRRVASAERLACLCHAEACLGSGLPATAEIIRQPVFRGNEAGTGWVAALTSFLSAFV